MLQSNFKNVGGEGNLAALLWRSDYEYRNKTRPFADF
jgi:hypothetical protein